MIMKEANSLICPYCKNPAIKITGNRLYPTRQDLAAKEFYACINCNAHVGCHKDGTPLGRLANEGLRAAKQLAHANFDPIWKSGSKTRKEAYMWLAKELNVPKEECHIGMFNLKTCKEVIHICKKKGHIRKTSN